MDTYERQKQTMMWCMHLPNSKKNINKMVIMFVDGRAMFVPKPPQ